jgi:uncharacterized membrane protein
MKIRVAEVLALLIVVASFFVGAYFYPILPDRVASHWNVAGEVDGYITKFWGAYLMPMMGVVLLALLFIIPRIDPQKHNIAKFVKYFDGFIVLLFLFLVYIYGLAIAWNLGVRFMLIKLMAPAMAILFYYCGVMISKAEMNWSIGVRTPWTLSSEKVWKKVHKTAGVMFRVAGIVCLLAFFWPDYAVWFIMVPVLLAAVISIVQSYVVYHQEHLKKRD